MAAWEGKGGEKDKRKRGEIEQQGKSGVASLYRIIHTRKLLQPQNTCIKNFWRFNNRGIFKSLLTKAVPLAYITQYLVRGSLENLL
jgi:hypothetical protein